MRVAELLKYFGVDMAERADGSHARVKCPYPQAHKNADEHPSCDINLESGKYICSSCTKTGDAIDYVAGFTGSSRAAIMTMVEGLVDDEEGEDGVVDVAIVERWHQALLKNERALGILHNRKGLSLETVKRHRLGWTGDRISMPIYSADGKVQNVRQWSPVDKNRKVIGVPGRNKLRLYPMEAMDNDVVIVVEGEMKALLLIQMGYNAVSPTGGAGKWLRKWGELFVGKIVVVMYDIDDAGKAGAARVLRSVWEHAKETRNLVLPLDKEKFPRGDITDAVVLDGWTKDDVAKVLTSSKEWTPALLAESDPQDNRVYDATLSESSHARLYNKLVKVECVVSAKDTAPYTVPKRFQVRCTRDHDYCAFCRISRSSEETPEVEVVSTDPVLLELINTRLDRQQYALKRAAGIPQICRTCAFVSLEMHNVEEVRLIPQLKIAENNGEHVVRRAFYVGHGIETNTSYSVEARCVPEPNTQYATLLIHDAKPQVDSLSKFIVTPEIHESLKVFQCEPTEDAVAKKLDEIYADLESNITFIRQRTKLHMVYDLVYHSVLYVPFQGQTHKGWVEALVIGDSSQGKSAALTAMMRHYSLGEKIDCKGSSVAGLLGGLQETSRRWFISWGVITLNDRRLVALEEAKGLSTEMIAKMTDARSSGVVEISKIEKAKTTCRCRLIWVSNSRSGRRLDTYNYGVEAVKELVGSLEDVRRFDMAIAVSSRDVPEEVINARIDKLPHVKHTYTTELCKNLILWAWSRAPEHVVFDDSAIDEVLQSATKMGRKYSSSIPLVESADQRLKLARLSCALAARLYSTDDGATLRVRAIHVKAIVSILESIYDSANLGYLEYSKLLLGDESVDDEHVVKKALKDLPFAADIVNGMLNASLIMGNDMSDWAGLTFDEGRVFLGLLVRKRALKRYRTAYIKTPAFTKLLKVMRDNGELLGPEKPKHVEQEL